MSEVIVRMPPSPTGKLHLGTARTVLFNYVFAKSHNGAIVFRWEDTDIERSNKAFEAEILEGLSWLGMRFPEEASIMVHQTDSLSEHKGRLEKLWEEGKVFPCFVTPEEIDQMREKAHKERTNFVFWSPYRDWDRAQLEAEMMTGKPYAWRFKTPQDRLIEWEDMVRGGVQINSKVLGDYVVARNNGTILYILANVFDDQAQSISHVIRGEDHITNTPKQLLLWEALGVNPPVYGHIPLVVDTEGKKLSKRVGTVLIADFRAQGYLPEAVLNGLAFLGWNPKTTEEIFSLSELIEVFKVEHINPAASKYDEAKIAWYNQKWAMRLDIEILYNRFLEWSEAYDPEPLKTCMEDATKCQKILEIVREKSPKFSDYWDNMAYFYEAPEVNEDLLEHEKMKVDKALSKSVLSEIATLLQNMDEVDLNRENLREICIERIQEMGLKNGQFLWPFRVALSGKDKSAGPFEMVEILGKEESLNRINAYLK